MQPASSPRVFTAAELSDICQDVAAEIFHSPPRIIVGIRCVYDAASFLRHPHWADSVDLVDISGDRVAYAWVRNGALSLDVTGASAVYLRAVPARTREAVAFRIPAGWDVVMFDRADSGLEPAQIRSLISADAPSVLGALQGR